MSAGWICPSNHFWRTEPTDATIDDAPACPECGGRGTPLDPSAPTLPPDAAVRPKPAAAVRVPGYEIMGELGRGGMGVVYKAREERLNRVVAVKMIPSGGHAAGRELTRFRREVEAVAALQHPNIVQIYAVGDADGLPYCAFEYVAGGTLADHTRSGPLDARRAARLVATLARAVQAAHDRDVVHRDLKPSNVLLTEDGTPKIADFGLAKRVGTDGTGTTASGTLLGTPAYMAPEQSGDTPKVVGPPADVYSLGAILYDLLTGRPPFAAATPLETVLKVLNEEPVPPRRLNSFVPRDLETVCLMCLRKEPRKRYASAAELADDLDRFLAGEPVRARPLGPGERVARLARRHRAAIGGAALASVIILLILALLPTPSPPNSSAISTAAPPSPPPSSVPPAVANFGGLEWFVKAGRSSGPAWGTAEAGVVGTSIEFLGMTSPDSPRPSKIEVVRKPGQAEEKSFEAVVEAVDRNMRVAKLRLGKAGTTAVAALPQPRNKADPVKLQSALSKPRDISVAVLERVRKSAVMIRTSGLGDATASGSGWVAGKAGGEAYVITNAHVLGMKEPAKPPPDTIDVLLGEGTSDERICAARLLAVDREEDLAVIRIKGNDLPEPLPIARSSLLQEGERLFILGFPSSPSLGMNIGPRTEFRPTFKVRESTVAGRILLKDGGVKYIQLEGGIDVGTSGGAVVDTSGQVNAVVVAQDPGFNLRLGIPSEYVSGLLAGRVLDVRPGQAVVSDADIRQPLRATIADPLQRLAKVTADIWTGKPGATRGVPESGAPKASPGDGAPVTVQLAYDPNRLVSLGEGDTAEAEAVLHRLKDGEVYWLRPHYFGKDGKDAWGEAVVLESGRFPVSKEPTVLEVRHRRSVAHRVMFDVRQNFRFDIAGLRASGVDQSMRVGFTERVQSVATNGDATVRLQYTDLNLLDANDQPALARAMRDIAASLKHLETSLTVTREGRYQGAKTVFNDVPESARTTLQQFDDQVTQSIGLLELGLPGKTVATGFSWKVDLNYDLATPGGDKQVALIHLTCRYVGRRVRDGAEEAVIEIDGVVSMPAAEKGRPGRGVSGVASGAVLVDLATGKTTLGRLDAELAVLFPYTLPNPQQAGQGIPLTVHAGVHLDLTLRRSLSDVQPPMLDENALLPHRPVLLRPRVGYVLPPGQPRPEP